MQSPVNATDVARAFLHGCEESGPSHNDMKSETGALSIARLKINVEMPVLATTHRTTSLFPFSTFIALKFKELVLCQKNGF